MATFGVANEELSPPPAVAHYYDDEGNNADSPTLLRCSNAIWLESPGGSAGPTPTRQPLKGLLSGELPAKGGDSAPVLTPTSWGPSQEGELIPAHLSPLSPEGPLLMPYRQPELAQPQVSGAGSVEESFISFSLSRASIGQAPAGCLLDDGAPVSSYFSVRSVTGGEKVEGPGRTQGEAPEEGEATTPAGSENIDAASTSSAGGPAAVWTGGHLFAPAANPRCLWSPSTQGHAHSSISSSPRSAARPSAHAYVAPGSHAPDNGEQLTAGQQGTGLGEQGGDEASPSVSRRQPCSNRLGQRNHPIFGLSRGEGAEPEGSASASLAGSAATSPTTSAAAAAFAAAAPGYTAAPSVAIPLLRALTGSNAVLSPQPLPAGSLSPQPLPPGSLSPSLPPLQPSLSPTIPPVSAHRRFHSALPPQLAHSGVGQSVQQLGGSLDRAWSITGSHIDLKLDMHRSFGGDGIGACGLQGGPTAAARPLVTPWLGSPARAVPSPLRRSATSVASSGPREPEHAIGLPPGTFAAAFRQFKRVNISHIKCHVLASPGHKPAPLVKRLAASCFNPVGGRLRWRLGRQRLRLACLGRLPYDPENVLHYSIMQAVVTGFAGVGRAADGWQEAGFTSANPSSTDLCGVGVLGLLHLVLLLERRPEIAAELYKAAAAVRQPREQAQQHRALAPALLSVRVTLWTLQALRAGLMTRPAQRLKSTSVAAECFYLGALECFLDCWQEAGEGEQLQEVLQRAEQRAKHNVWPMVKRALPGDVVVH